MLFNSFHFLYFILVLLPIYYISPHKYRWIILLVASCYFYMTWNPFYVVLIFFTTITSYLASIGIENTQNVKNKKVYLWSSVIASLGVLFYFKYYNFFIDTVNTYTRSEFEMMDFLLPIGISFYTFQTMSYTIDVYRKDIKAERHFGIYALFVIFFPPLVAGPIERSESLMPQFRKTHKLKIENFIIGCKQIIIGFFMKLVIADRLSIYVDTVYNNVDSFSGYTFILATLSFSFQILCDFAGYSIIALGVAKLFDYDLTINFRRPYMALSFSEFWKRWHISLSSWFRDYLYIPLGGSRTTKLKVHRNLLITFLVSGLWHGANWTFIVWGGLHGLYLIAENLITNKNKSNLTSYYPFRIAKRIFILCLVSFAWIFFRANSLSEALTIVKKMFDFSQPVFLDSKVLFYGALGVFVLLLIDHFAERLPKENIFNSPKWTFSATLLFSILFIMILYLGVFDGGQFIYFQF